MPGTPATSPRLGAPRYSDADVASFAAQVNAVTDAVDLEAAGYLSGTAAARPAAATANKGFIYFATDTVVYSVSTGAAWQTMLVAGSDQNLTLATSWSSSGPSFVPISRLEGDTVRLTGRETNGTGGTVTSGTVATLPSPSLYPGGTRVVFASVLASGGSTLAGQVQLFVSNSGPISVAGGGSIANGQQICLDGITYRI